MGKIENLSDEIDEIDRILGADASEDDTAKEGPLIVVIDDDATIRMSLEYSLKEHYQVEVFSNGKDAVEALKPESAVVILDIKMPDHDGFWTFRELRDIDADLPIIFHSAYQDLEDPFIIINEYRPFGYLNKSGDLAELMTMIRKAVEYRERVDSQRHLMDQLRKVKSDMEDLRKSKGWEREG